jgi:hypothetical protein
LKLSKQALTGFGSLPEPGFELLFAMSLEVIFCGRRGPYLCITRDMN